PLQSWKDIGGRDIYFSTVQKYIASAHSYNMKTMFYDLVYGAWENAEADGVKKEWYIYKDNTHTNLDFFALSSPFLSNLYLLDPANTNWQNYMINEANTVYSHLGFDGYHMDQVGNRGARFRYDGTNAMLENSFKSYINAFKTAIPAKYNVLNAVAQYGQQGIATSTSDFLYTEVWSPSDSYNDLVNIIKQNNTLCNNTKNTVLAAYMNYDMGASKGYFNTPSVLMTNAVIFAFGGAHIELGEHMLCREYFPNGNLSMKDDLKKSLVNYYDFAVAYQNMLRDGGTFNSVTVASIDKKMAIDNWPASQTKVAVFGKKMDNKQMIHFINFSNSTTQKWRDNTAIQVMPALIKDAKLVLTSDATVKKIWIATPDFVGGASRNLNFYFARIEILGYGCC
ncbi:MAG: glycoside hydrolase family 66 protein, partial [Paludibacter sp.]